MMVKTWRSVWVTWVKICLEVTEGAQRDRSKRRTTALQQVFIHRKKMLMYTILHVDYSKAEFI